MQRAEFLGCGRRRQFIFQNDSIDSSGFEFDKSMSLNLLTETASSNFSSSDRKRSLIVAQRDNRIYEDLCISPCKISRTDSNSRLTHYNQAREHKSNSSGDSSYDQRSRGSMTKIRQTGCTKSGLQPSDIGVFLASSLVQSEVPKLICNVPGCIPIKGRTLDAIPASANLMKLKAGVPQAKSINRRKHKGYINLMDAVKGRAKKTGKEGDETDQQRGASMFSSGKLCSPSAVSSEDNENYSSSSEYSRGRRRIDLSAVNTEEKAAQERDEGLYLVSLLLKCATAVAKNERSKAASLLMKIYKRAGMFGDPMQRLSAYFAESLAARLVTKDSPLYKTLMLQPSAPEFFRAFAALHKVSPCFQFGHFTCNQAILEAFEGHQILHVIDINTARGFQWSSLLQSLAARPEGPPTLLRVTGIGRSEEMLQETAHRLSNFAKNVNICFEFEAIVENQLESLSLERLLVRPGEAIAVNCVFELHRLLNDKSGRKITQFISTMRRLRPLVLTIVEQEANHNAPTFLGRFMEALHYYAAIFDSLDASFPQQSDDRLRIEQLFFARQIKNIVACEDGERIERHESSESWKQRMENAGFELMHLSDHAISQAKLLLQFFPCEGYRLTEKGGLLSLGWQERQLITASAWTISRPL